MKNALIGFLIGVIFVGGGVWYFFQQKSVSTAQKPTPTISNISPAVTITQKLIGGDKDSHGCLIAAGYQWCEVKQKCLRSFEESCDKPEINDADAIAQALALKNKWATWENLEITISSNDGTYAKGGVRDKNEVAGGGYWFAKKVSGKWEIVADGNGMILCSSLKAYPDYPVSLIPECYDDVKAMNIKR